MSRTLAGIQPAALYTGDNDSAFLALVRSAANR
jgi:hypothetical protein